MDPAARLRQRGRRLFADLRTAPAEEHGEVHAGLEEFAEEVAFLRELAARKRA